MPKYVIERSIPGAGQMTDEEWQGAAVQSNAALQDVGDGVTWLHSYVTGEKVYCIYDAEGPDIIRDHGRCGGFPTDVISEVTRMVDPSTATASSISKLS